MKKLCLFVSVVLFLSLPVSAADYPNMVGIWKGHIRIVSSGASVADQVARGGAVLSELELTLTIEYQDGETFIGNSRASTTPKGQPSIPVWGAIRSDGKEALFVAANGGRGDLWFGSAHQFEFCLTSLNESTFSAYCGVMKKE